MADQKPTTVTDEPGITPAKVTQKDDTAARTRYGKLHGLEGKALQKRWDSIPDGLREAYRIQVRS